MSLSPGPIGDAFVRNFDSLADLERYATQVMDHELLGKIRIVKTCHHNLPSLIAKIRSKAIGDTDTAGVSQCEVSSMSLNCCSHFCHVSDMLWMCY